MDMKARPMNECGSAEKEKEYCYVKIKNNKINALKGANVVLIQ